jgi:hypothetical protein
MATRMIAGAMLAVWLVGCSAEEEPQASDPESAPQQVSDSGESGEEPKSPFKPVESKPIEDMQPVVVADEGLKKIEPQTTAAPAPAPPLSVPEPMVSTTRPVDPPRDRVPLTDDDRKDDDKQPTVASDDDGRRPRWRGRSPSGQGVAVSPGMGMAGSPVISAIPSGSGLGAGGGGFGQDAVGLPEFGSGDLGDGDELASGPGGGPAAGHGIALSGVLEDFDLVADDLAATADGLGPGGRQGGGPTDPGGDAPTGPVDGGLSPLPPVPPPDF